MGQPQVQARVQVYYQPAPVRLEELDSGDVAEEATKVISRLEDKNVFSRDLTNYTDMYMIIVWTKYS